MRDGSNRFVLVLLSVLLVAAGVVGLLAAADAIPLVQPSELFDRASATISARPSLWWTVIIAVLVLLAILGLVWALRQLVVRRPGGALSTVTVEAGRRGRTTVEASTVAAAAATDLRRLDQVTDSSARLVADGRDRVLRTRLEVLSDADLDEVRREAEEVYQRVAMVLGSEELPTHTRLRPVGGEEPRRVR